MKWKSALRHAVAVLLGIAMLDGFCAWYYNPAPYQYTPDRATDVVRRPGAWTSQAKEGHGVHVIDRNGYNNPPDAADGPISVLMLGSSHTEGLNVPAGANVAAVLDGLLRDAGRSGRVYNLGMSAHTFGINAANLGNALARFAPTDYVALELQHLVFYTSMILDSRDRTAERLPDTDVPLPGWISDRPLSKRLYKQFAGLLRVETVEEAEDSAGEIDLSPADEQRYVAALTDWFARLAGEAEAAGVRLILWYHPNVLPDMEGGATTDAPEVCRRAFRRASEAAGVLFVDLTERFLEAYARERVLPTGFANTALGAGHMNRDGHRLAAEALFEAIQAEEAAR